MKVAVLASDNMLPGAAHEREDAFERDEQMGKLVPALAAHGIGCDLRRWRDLADFASDYDAVLPLLCWDYWDEREHFLDLLSGAPTRVLNPPTILRWNTDKAYLAELSQGGAPTIPELSVDLATDAVIAQAFDSLQADTLVVKPRIGGGAWRQVLVHRDQALPLRSERPPGPALIQPFMDAILTEGEISLLYFDGQFSHGLRKTAKSGDYRIQSQYGGREVPYLADSAMVALAESVLQGMDSMPLYARVDLLRGNDGDWRLIEVECVEPYLYFGLSDGEGADNLGARNFANALAERLKG